MVYGHFVGVCKIRVGVISNTNLYSYGGHRISNTEIALKSDIIAKLTSMCNFSSLLMFHIWTNFKNINWFCFKTAFDQTRSLRMQLDPDLQFVNSNMTFQKSGWWQNIECKGNSQMHRHRVMNGCPRILNRRSHKFDFIGSLTASFQERVLDQETWIILEFRNILGMKKRRRLFNLSQLFICDCRLLLATQVPLQSWQS